jgi:peptidoglycan/LPS O-acetylase OafA/YrhL
LEERASPERAVPTRFGGHLAALDGVRGIAISSVLLFHFVANTISTNVFERLVNQVLNYGSLGVDLFFALSGFLITGILYDARGEADYFKNFYMRRVLRIFPLYYAVLVVVFFVLPLIPALAGSEIVSLRDRQAWAWLYAVNIYLSIHGDWVLGHLTHFWSLAVEEHFYFVWPFVVYGLAARPKRLMQAALGLAAASFVARLGASLAGVNGVALTVLTPFQLDALCLGGFFAVYLRQPGGEAAVRRFLRPAVLVTLAATAAVYALNTLAPEARVFTLPLRAGLLRLLLVAVLLWALLAAPESRASAVFRAPSLAFFGKYAYGLYVYHHFLSHAFVTHKTEFVLASLLGSHTLAVVVQATAGIAVTVALAYVSYEYFEKPFLKLKRFWPSSRDAAAAKG